jgi:hypothetical protein
MPQSAQNRRPAFFRMDMERGKRRPGKKLFFERRREKKRDKPPGKPGKGQNLFFNPVLLKEVKPYCFSACYLLYFHGASRLYASEPSPALSGRAAKTAIFLRKYERLRQSCTMFDRLKRPVGDSQPKPQ